MILASRRIPKPISSLSAHARTSRAMATDLASTPTGPSTDVEKFGRFLKSSTRILALCGAGLSAASGLDTFRGAGGMWRNHKAQSLATPEAFERDPGLVWLFYSYRRHKALQAAPNAGHYALTELSKKKPGFITLTQNVDGLSQRANHPREQLKLLHGTLFDIKCFDCDYIEQNNYDDPFHPLLAIDTVDDPRLAPSSTDTTEPPVDNSTPIDPAALPHCPQCHTGLLRPGVVWFGEPLPEDTLAETEEFLQQGYIDLIMVIGTSAKVQPAAEYIHLARMRGARVALINTDANDLGAIGRLKSRDYLFEGDSSKILPEILKPVIGDLADYMTV